MKCPECDFVQSDQDTKCSKCGFIFERYQRPQASTLRKGVVTAKRENAAGDGTFIQKTVFSVEPKVNPFYFGGRIVVGLVIFIWGWVFILTPMATNYAGDSFFTLSTFLSTKRAIFSFNFLDDGWDPLEEPSVSC